jgi:hypothetical protein
MVDDAIEIIALFLYEYMYINLSFEYRPFSLSPLQFIPPACLIQD